MATCHYHCVTDYKYKKIFVVIMYVCYLFGHNLTTHGAISTKFGTGEETDKRKVSVRVEKGLRRKNKLCLTKTLLISGDRFGPIISFANISS